MTLRDAAQQALAALEEAIATPENQLLPSSCDEAITTLRAALAWPDPITSTLQAATLSSDSEDRHRVGLHYRTREDAQRAYLAVSRNDDA